MTKNTYSYDKSTLAAQKEKVKELKKLIVETFPQEAEEKPKMVMDIEGKKKKVKPAKKKALPFSMDWLNKHYKFMSHELAAHE